MDGVIEIILGKNSRKKICTGLSFSLTINSADERNSAIAENLRQQWANAGIIVTIKSICGKIIII